jgi:hypothetical protein
MHKKYLVILSAILLILALGSCADQVGKTDTPVASEPPGEVVTVYGGYTGATTWTHDKLYYIEYWAEFSSSLTIEAGTTVAFGAGATLTIDASGQLNAIGTSAAPITFTSAKEGFTGFAIPGVSGSPAMADWDYIWIDGNSSSLEYCDIRYADDGLDISANSVTVRHDNFTNNTVGLNARGAGSGFIVGVNTFYGNTHPFLAGRNFSIDDTNSFQNGNGSIKNTYQAIEFQSGSIDSSITWNCTTVACAVPESNGWLVLASGTFTLGTGTVLKFGGGGELTIGIGATLANFTNAEFTSIKDDTLLGDSDGGSSTPAADDWVGIWDDNGSDWFSGAYLHYCTHL